MPADAHQGGTIVVTGRPAFGGLLGLARRQLQERWFESLLIVAGIAIGSAVMSAGASFIWYTTHLTSRQVALVPSLRAITVRPKGIDWTSLFDAHAPPAQRIEPRLLEPVQITRADVRAIKATIPGVAFVTTGIDEMQPQRIVALDDGPVVAETDSVDAGQPPSFANRLVALPTTPDLFGYLSLRTLAGASFTWKDYDAGRQVMVINETLAKRLFPGLELRQVVGRTVTTETARWSIVGVVSTDAFTQLLPQLQSSGVGYVPDTAVSHLSGVGSDVVAAIEVVPQDPAQTGKVLQALQTYFDGKYGQGRVQLDSFLAQLEDFTRSQRGFAVSAMVLVSLGMVIAAINILNLFMARVARRRRLLGLSAALGASRPLLFVQTVLEAIILGTVGATLGVGLAVPLLRGLNSLIQGTLQQVLRLLEMPPLGLAPAGAAAGLGAGLLCGLAFGIYPAWVSSRIHPAEAMRGERVILRVVCANWGRTLVAVLQVGVAVGAVVAVVASGIPTLVSTSASSMQLLEVTYSAVGDEANPFVRDSLPIFTVDDARLVMTQADAVQAAAIFDSVVVALIQVGEDVYAIPEYAVVTPEFAQLADLHLAAGSFFSDGDMQEGESRVAVLSEPLARMLFWNARAAVGQALILRPQREALVLAGLATPQQLPSSQESGRVLRVVGVFQPLGGNVAFRDVSMMLPAATRQPATGGAGVQESRFSALYVKPKPGRERDAQQAVGVLLASRIEERAAEPQYQDRIVGLPYELTVREPLATSTVRTMLLWQLAVTAGIGVLAAVVAGIAVLTVSLANVAEQTRAIALRRALGATRGRVLREVLAQSLVLSGLGGVVGILLAWPLERLLEPALPTATLFSGGLGGKYAALGWMVAIPVGLSLCLGIGTLAGLYPAWEASRTPPAEVWREVA